jgi:hypothetical protein
MDMISIHYDRYRCINMDLDDDDEMESMQALIPELYQ